jgi:type I restriction-modification system DNA methylase subunit
MSLASFTQELDRLVSNFDRNKAFHSSKDFQESQLRVDFVSPLFEALGWDVSNRAGNPPHLREVVVESRVEEKGHRRRADYTFQVSGQPRLVVETKRPSEDLEDPRHILQLKKYAWNLQVRFAVLTNFLQTKIYAVPAPPVFTQPNEFLLEQVEFLQYLAKPDLLYGLLSKERVLEGALDKYFETIPKHKRDKAYQRSLFRLRGSKMVDDHFLDDLMEFRRDLARDIVQRNSRAGLTEPEVNEAVQRVIDRIVFLRIGEDRGIIYDPTLLDLVEKWGSKGSRVSFYPRLVEHFGGFNRPYNGLLFKPHSLSEGLDLSDEVLAGFIEKISVETSPYRFDVIPVEILGSIYERFLGSVVRITPARVKVEEKPEVRKAGGVYYTPKYIVDYIVSQTVGKLLEGRTPEQVAGLRVLDPACGSGSFLLGAFTRIMEYLVEWFHDHPKTNGKYQAWFDRDQDGTVRLSPYAKRHILLNNIYGVDIDPQACEVTQLSLYLKLLEGESKESLREYKEKGHAEAFLPDLRNNIKCGNSLVGTEFEDEAQTSLLEGKPGKRVNVFDWEAEFPGVMKGGGFDCVIGNPPYIRIQTMKEWAPLEVELYKKHYVSASKGNYDIYVVFVERGLSLLNKRGRLGFILPHKFFNAQYGEGLRGLISKGRHLAQVVHFGDQQVFEGATTYTCLMFLENAGCNRCQVEKVDDLRAWRDTRRSLKGSIKATNISGSPWNLAIGEGSELLERMSKVTTKLDDVARIFQGLVTGADNVFVLEELAQTKKGQIKVRDYEGVVSQLEETILRPFLNNVTVSSFVCPSSQHRIIFPYRLHNKKADLISSKEMATSYSKVWDYLKGKGNVLRGREGGKWNNERWYAFGRTQNMAEMNDPKLIVQVISQIGRYAYDNMGLHFTGGGNGPYYGIRWSESNNRYSLYYLQGLLNSRLLDFYLHRISSPFRGGYWSYGKRFIEQLPIRTINFGNRSDKARHDKMVKLVERMMELHKELTKAKSDHDKTLLQRQISSADRQINRLVYGLYDLSDEETKIVEQIS